MLEAINRIFRWKSGSTEESTLAGFYRSRLYATKNSIEVEAILYMSSLISLYDWNDQNNEESE